MSLSFGILGLLNYYPMSGYDLKKAFDDSINFFWPAKTSQIYRELKSLEQKKNIVSRVEPSAKGPHKKIYTITEQGRKNLVDWLANPPETISEGNRNALALRILHSSVLGLDKLIPVIRKQMDAYRTELAQLDIVEPKLQTYLERSGHTDHIPYWQIVLNKGRHINRANLVWAEETLAFIEDKQKKVKPQ